jgi:hypothetical protein
MIEQEIHELKGQRVRITACRGNHGKNEGCVCDFKEKDAILGNKLIFMSPAPDTYRIQFGKVKKLVRLDEVHFIS